MTRLAYSPVDDETADLLSLVADEQTPLGSLNADRFRAACWSVALAHAGDVDPNLVRARLLNAAGELDMDPRAYSALWAGASGRDGFLDKTDRLVPITGSGSRGNGGKAVRMRRWRGWSG